MTTILDRARAEALFVSCCQPSQKPSAVTVRAAVAEAIRSHGGVRGCACDVAAEFGDHPDTAAARMVWALATVEAVYHSQRAGAR